jgi:hypothetical protein
MRRTIGTSTPGVGSPTVNPDTFQDFEGFRETTLSLITKPEDNAALRATGRLIYAMATQLDDSPPEPEGAVRHQCRAAVADLRHLQGYLGMLGRELECSHSNHHEGYLARVCGRLAPQVQEIADVLDKELGTWRGEE